MNESWEAHLRDLPGIVLRSADTLYPSVAAALDALDWLESRSYVLLGFDGIDTDGQYIRPRLDAIADFSTPANPVAITSPWGERVRESAAAGRGVLNEWLGKVQFVDLVVQGPDEQ